MTARPITEVSSPRQASELPRQPYRAFFWLAAAAIGFLQIWAHRFDVNPDGITYMQMAWTTVRIGLAGVVDAHRSPFYPWLLSVVLRIFRPDAGMESTIVHLADYAIYLVNIACFEFFLRELLRVRAVSAKPGSGRVRIPDQVLWLWGYVFFLWAGREWLKLEVMTPDLCVAAVAYVVTGILLRIRRGRDSWPWYLVLGAVLGLGFLAKAFLFLVGWVFLACSVFAAKSFRRAWPRALVAALLFAAIAAPEILALSRKVGHWTFSDSGSFNYAWFVDRVPIIFWQGGPPRSGMPVHRQRVLLDHPAVYEFPVASDGTFHDAGDTAYWYEGVHPYFQWPGQLRVLAASVGFYVQMITRTGALYAAFLVLFLFLRGSGRWNIEGALDDWAVWLPSYAAMGLFALVLVESRYVAPFVLMLLLGWFALMEPARQRLEGHLPLLALATIFLAAVVVLVSAGRDAIAIARPAPAPQFLVARALESSGLLEGTSTDFVHADVAPRACAAGIGGTSANWSHMTAVRVVAVAPDGKEFWQADAATQSDVLNTLRGAGAGFVLAGNASASGNMVGTTDGWQKISGTDIYIYRFTPPSVSAGTPPAAFACPSSSPDTSR